MLSLLCSKKEERTEWNNDNNDNDPNDERRDWWEGCERI